MVNTGGLVNNTRNRETCFDAGFTVSDFSFRVIKSIAWFRRIRRRILGIRHLDFQSIAPLVIHRPFDECTYSFDACILNEFRPQMD